MRYEPTNNTRTISLSISSLSVYAFGGYCFEGQHNFPGHLKTAWQPRRHGLVRKNYAAYSQCSPILEHWLRFHSRRGPWSRVDSNARIIEKSSSKFDLWIAWIQSISTSSKAIPTQLWAYWWMLWHPSGSFGYSTQRLIRGSWRRLFNPYGRNFQSCSKQVFRWKRWTGLHQPKQSLKRTLIFQTPTSSPVVKYKNLSVDHRVLLFSCAHVHSFS